MGTRWSGAIGHYDGYPMHSEREGTRGHAAFYDVEFMLN